MKSMTLRALVYGLIIVVGLLSALPNVLPGAVSPKLPDWYTNNTLTLGLDLRGGSHLLMAVDGDELILARYRQLAEEITAELRDARLRHSPPRIDRSGIQVSATDIARVQELVSLLQPLLNDASQAVNGYDVTVRGSAVVIRARDAYIDALEADAVERSLEVVRRRLNETGLVDPSITRQGKTGILVQLPGVDDPRQIRQLLGTTAKMTFHWAADNQSRRATPVITLSDPIEQTQYRLEQRVALEGEHIRDARLAYDPETGQPVVHFTLDNEGARLFADMTRDNIGRALAIVLDDTVITAPVIRSVIGGGSGEISGRFTPDEAGDLALLLRSGALPAPLTVLEERTVGPDLGRDAIAMGVSTGTLGAVLVLVFMLGLYGRWGLISNLALTLNLGLIFGVLSALGATLTLPGIAGIILSLGMAVDANILINERIREESGRGKSAYYALDAGFKRAYGTILDSNVTTLIAVGLLFLFGNGPVRGFAVTMAIGLGASMFTAISVTRLLMEWQVRKLGRRPLRLSGFTVLNRLHRVDLDFMRHRFIGLGVSALLSVAAIALLFHPGPDYGVDFSGGTVVEVQAPNTPISTLREALTQPPLDQASLQEFGENGRYLVRLPIQEDGAVGADQQVDVLKSAITAQAPDATFPRVDMVGPKVSGDFAEATVLAIVLAGAGMLGYLWLRFESHFAIAAMLTLALDLTKTLGFFALTGVEFNLTAVAALLALIGYSVNDKVVVFDRIRENLRLSPDQPLMTVMNESIRSTLSRTVFTSVTTFLAILPMAIAGGDAVASFALPMLFGIVIGTSSSVWVAAPILLLLGRYRTHRGLAQLRPSAEEVEKELALIP